MSSLSAGTTTGTALVHTADTSGDLLLKTGSSATTAMTISGSTQAVTLAGSLVMGSATLAQPAGSAPLAMARAWVNFNGTGTPAIRASGNVSSITDNGVGIYTVNFTTAMPDANYAMQGTCEGENGMGFASFGMYVSQYFSTVPTAGAVTIATLQDNNTFEDSRFVHVTITR